MHMSGRQAASTPETSVLVQSLVAAGIALEAVATRAALRTRPSAASSRRWYAMIGAPLEESVIAV
jgi:uncharacterized protein